MKYFLMEIEGKAYLEEIGVVHPALQDYFLKALFFSFISFNQYITLMSFRTIHSDNDDSTRRIIYNDVKTFLNKGPFTGTLADIYDHIKNKNISVHR